MVTKTIKPTPKFKKYPDEDAPNPFKGMQGKNAEKPSQNCVPINIENTAACISNIYFTKQGEMPYLNIP